MCPKEQLRKQLNRSQLPTIWTIPDAMWVQLKELLPKQKDRGTSGRPPVPFRKVIDGILFILRTGCQWNAVPSVYGSGWRDGRAHPVGGGAFVAPGNSPGQGQGDDERVAFVMQGRRVLVCELFPHHMRGTSEGKAFGRLKAGDADVAPRSRCRAGGR